MITLLVMATEQATANPIVSILVNGGIMGAVFLLTVFGKGLHTDGEVSELKNRLADKDEVIEDKDETIRQKDEIIRRFQDQFGRALPAMARSADVLEAIPDKESAMLEEVRKAQNETLKLVQRLESLQGGKL